MIDKNEYINNISKTLNDIDEIKKMLTNDKKIVDPITTAARDELYDDMYNGLVRAKKFKKSPPPNVTVKIPTELGSVHRSITSTQTLLKNILEHLVKADKRLWNPAFEMMDNEEVKMTRDEIGAYLDDMKDLLIQYDKMSALVKDMLQNLNKKAKEFNEDGSLTFEVPRTEFK